MKPNDFGMFDTLGNAWEWVFDAYVPYPEQGSEVVEDLTNTQPLEATGRRVLRGGAFTYRPVTVRSAYRYNLQPDTRTDSYGFRPARTYP